jgi:hypothetical protein
MRTVQNQIVSIQLMILTRDPVSFISKWKRGQEDKIAERQRESEGERARERERGRESEGERAREREGRRERGREREGV